MSLLPSGAIETGGYDINNSLRFRSSASAYLSRTPASAGNTQKWTWSAWVKLGKLSTFSGLFGALNGTDRMYIGYGSSAKWQIYGTNAGTDYVEAYSTGLYRDPSAWYHLVIAVDTTQATASNRLKMYVNGTQETVSFTTNMTLNANTSINKAIATVIGETSVGNDPFDGYMAEVNFIDGSAKTPSDFGETDTTTGVWKPKAYSGTYGTNGFYLKFSDIATTSGSNAGLGKDFSGNSNYWTTNNISVTSGTTYDAMTDVPTNTSATVANYCVMNPLNTYSSITINNANLQLTLTEAAYRKAIATMAFPTTGTYYCEANLSGGINYVSYGIVTPEAPLNNAVGSTATGYGAITSGSQWDRWNNGTASGNFWNITTTNPTLQIAIDTTNGKLWLGYNNTWLDSSGGLTGNPSTGANATFTIDTSRIYLPSFGGYLYDSMIINTNFGQRPFAYTPPTGYVALNTYNLPTPTILQGNKYMDAKLYTGTNANQSINTYGFSPDLIWIKNRDNVEQHHLVDSVRGNNKFLLSNSTAAERTGSLNNGYNQVNLASTGFDIVSNGLNDELNLTGRTYVAWGWDANGAGSTNTAGSITSTVSANTTAGFSIIKYTGTQVNDTIGHGLGVAPKMVIIKTYGGGTRGWRVYHESLGNTKYLILNDTTAATTDSTAWNNTTPTSSLIYLGANGETNNGGSLMIAYAWAEIAGFSKFGSYTGNGSADGVFVYLGFRPKFVLIKRTDTTASWELFDTSRNTYNSLNLVLYPNLSDAEGAYTAGEGIDSLSNGFKLRKTGTGLNNSGGTYIYMAFAENPFKNSLAR